MLKIIPVLILFSAVAAPVAAQNADALRQGVRIQVMPVEGKAQTGTLISLRNDSLFYSRDQHGRIHDVNTSSTSSFAYADVKSVQVSRGRSALGGALTKGLLGTGIGLLSGAILGAATYSDPPPADCAPNSFFCLGCIVICSRGQAAVAVGALGGGLGLIAGSIYGATHGNERWESVALPKP
jgi:hypothetical protein